MPVEDFRVGRIKTWQGPFSVESFRKQFATNAPLETKDVLFFGGDPTQVKKDVLDPLKFDQHNPIAQIARELQVDNVASSAIPFDQPFVPHDDYIDPNVFLGTMKKYGWYKKPKSVLNDIKPPAKKRLKVDKQTVVDSINTLFHTVGYGDNIVLPVRPTKEYGVYGIPKFDLSYQDRTKLIEQGILNSDRETLALWNGYSSDYLDLTTELEMKKARHDSKIQSNWANKPNVEHWHKYFRKQHRRVTRDYFFADRIEAHEILTEGLLLLQKMIDLLESAKNSEDAKAKLANFKLELKAEGKLTVDQCHKLIDQIVVGMNDKEAFLQKEAELAASIKVRLNTSSSPAPERPLTEKEWLNAIDDAKAIAKRMEKEMPISFVNPKPAINTIRIGFMQPIEWLTYKPASNTMNVTRHCTQRSFRVIVEMAVQKKMKWIDVGDLPEKQVAAIKEQVRLMGADLQVRDSDYKPVLTQRLESMRSIIAVPKKSLSTPVQPVVEQKVHESRAVFIH